ncbi:hypothetical protein [Geothrix sp. 21YS21S-2]|uniref:hypothetical protein n=1 Tax=Geothrix sp. 21YS21S-2 TaxID=3068893 RepID=UPI0027B8ED35|nr:hypothetical protein [Geothrix sp. 21YS21S-2]
MRAFLLPFAFALCAQAQTLTPDPWAPVRFLSGEWTGVSSGEPGTGTAQRTYRFVMGAKFLHERNVSTYLPTAAGKPGEVHEHWSMFSYDKKRKRLVVRQFHQESFVNQYAFDEDLSSPKRLVFVSEAFENLDSRWRAREAYDLVSPDEFRETFEIAPPGKDYAVYATTVFKRVPAR